MPEACAHEPPFWLMMGGKAANAELSTAGGSESTGDAEVTAVSAHSRGKTKCRFI